MSTANIIDSISPLMAPKLVEVNPSCGLIKLPTYYAVVTAHQKCDVSYLTMGVYQNYYHYECRIHIYDGLVYLSYSTVYNNHFKSPGASMPYSRAGELIQRMDARIAPMIEELIAIERDGLKPVLPKW